MLTEEFDSEFNDLFLNGEGKFNDQKRRQQQKQIHQRRKTRKKKKKKKAGKRVFLVRIIIYRNILVSIYVEMFRPSGMEYALRLESGSI